MLTAGALAAPHFASSPVELANIWKAECLKETHRQSSCPALGCSYGSRACAASLCLFAKSPQQRCTPKPAWERATAPSFSVLRNKISSASVAVDSCNHYMAMHPSIWIVQDGMHACHATMCSSRQEAAIEGLACHSSQESIFVGGTPRPEEA